MTLQYVSETNILEQPQGDDCGYDLRSAFDYSIEPGEQIKVQTDLSIALPKGCWGNIRDRSSVAAQMVYTHAGVIDAGFRGQVAVLLENRNRMPIIIRKGHKVAQLIICPYISIPVEKVDSLDETVRGSGGFGSTGQ
jgi:dUTP pyrophosphatase